MKRVALSFLFLLELSFLVLSPVVTLAGSSVTPARSRQRELHPLELQLIQEAAQAEQRLQVVRRQGKSKQAQLENEIRRLNQGNSLSVQAPATRHPAMSPVESLSIHNASEPPAPRPVPVSR